MANLRRLLPTLAAIGLCLIAAPLRSQVPPPVPALPDTERRTTYSPSASVGPFNVNFALYGDGTDYGQWVEVWLNGAKLTAVTAWQLTSPTGPLATIPRPITNAQVTLVSAATGTLQIVGARRPRRASQLTENQGVSARNFNQTFTDQVAVTRESWDRVARSLLAPPGESLAGLPASATRAGQLLGFDGSGNPIAYVPGTVSPSAVTCASQNFVSSITSGGVPSCASIFAASGGGTTNFLRADGTWSVPTGSVGGMTYPGSPYVIGDILYANTTGSMARLADVAAGSFLASGGVGAAPTWQAAVTSNPLLHPGSSNLVGSGCNPAQAHSLWWVDQNLCSIADAWVLNSSDPSALLQFTLTGSVTSARLQTLTFTFGAGACAAGCPVTYTTVVGDTLTSVATALVAAIKANANLYNNVAGAQGQVLTTSTFGSPTVNSITIDFNSAVSMKVTATDAAGTIAYNLPAACGVACSAAWDTNPQLAVNRNPGFAPPANSQLFNLQVGGSDSATPASIVVPYGNLSVQVLNSTHGAITSRWLMTTPDVNGNLTQGVYVGAGGYTPNTTDLGIDSYNALTYGLGPQYSIKKNANQFQFTTGNTTQPFVFSSVGAIVMGVNMAPTGTVDVNGTISSLGAAGTPTTGSGVSLVGGAAPVIQSFNWGTSAFLPQVFAATSWDFKPSNSATSGWTLSTNKLAPDADNATQIGDGTHNVSTLFAKAISGLTTPLSVAQGGTGDTGAAWTAYTPALTCGTATFGTVTARAKTLGKTTWAQIEFTITAIGTCTTPITFTLPNTANSGGAIVGYENVTANTSVSCLVAAASATATCGKPAAAAFGVNNHVVASGVYENQ